MKIVYIICRHIVGLLFVISGFTKAVDPQGTILKFQEYIQVLNVEYLLPYIFWFALLLTIIEFVVGFNILLHIHMKISTTLAYVLMLIFLPLTIYAAITGKVEECGCFGDAIKLTNWETVYKNIILVILLTFVVIFYKRFTSYLNLFGRIFLLAVGIIFVIAVAWHGIKYLPLVDFRPMHIGADIVKSTEVPNDQKALETKRIFYYEKNGEIKEFDETNYPWKDTTWHFVKQKVQMENRENDPPLKDFFIEHTQEGDITKQILEDENYTFLIVSESLFKGRWDVLERIVAIKDYCFANNFNFYVVTSSTTDQIDSFTNQHSVDFMICTADETMLKTIIRSNPGMIVLKDGIVLVKYAYAEIPKAEKLSDNFFPISLQKAQTNNYKLIILALFLIISFIITLNFGYKKQAKTLNYE